MHTIVHSAGTVQINVYAVVARAVEEGAGRGWHRAHKHTAQPEQFAAIEAIANAVMEALDEVIMYPPVVD